jgi:tetratricopeptide (TPR) repeat protein
MLIIVMSFLIIILLFYFFVADSRVFSFGYQMPLQRDAIQINLNNANGIAPPDVVILTDHSSVADQKLAYENAHFFYVNGNTAQAIGQYQILLNFFPDDVQLRNNYANILRDLERFDEALAQYRRVIEIDRTFTPAYLNLVYLLDDLQRPDEALAVLGAGLESNPDRSELRAIKTSY